MKLKIKLITVSLAACLYAAAQVPQPVGARPLKEVLTDIMNRYKVSLLYNEGVVKSLEVTYPEWRYRNGIEATLAGILMPLDLVFEKTGQDTFTISRFTYYQRPVAEGEKHLERLLKVYPGLTGWEKRKQELRECILETLGLSPLPAKTPLNPIYTPVRKMDGYTVQNVGIETLPGVYLCGSLYRPSKGKGPFPAVLSPHGHFSDPDPDKYGRYRPDQQFRCAMLARMGAVVFSYEMFAYGESRLQVSESDHRTPLSLTVQTNNSIRVIDFLTSLSYVDRNKIAVTGESGGGTQAFLLTALDDRITVSVPVVMVSSWFFGGCPCESGLPYHFCTSEFTNNAEIAAMASPRPMLVISDGNDWTRSVPEVEFPYLKKVYSLYSKPENVESAHFPDEGHDYGLSKRLAMYDFLGKHLGLNTVNVKDSQGRFDESKVTIEKHESLLVFGKEGKLPANAVKGIEEVRQALESAK